MDVFIQEIILGAGKILLDKFNTQLSISKKAHNDYVTEVDFAVESYLKSAISEKYPDHNILAEETDHIENDSSYTWYIDPLSSTDNFIHTMPHFGIAVAVEKDGEILFGAAYDPIQDELFFAEKGKGSTLNGQVIRVSEVSELKKAILFFDAGTRGSHEMARGKELYPKIFDKVNCIRRIGSCAIEFSYIACGRADCSVYAYSDPYSFPAGKIILEEAGGKMGDIDGNEWTPDTKITVASNGKLHGEVLGKLMIE